MSISLIVGLGNPGSQYADTRHNVGWWWLEALCEKLDITLKDDKKLHAAHGKETIAGRNTHFLKPTTFMNLSGKALVSCMNFYKLQLAETLVIHDELDLPAGTIRLKKEGGHGGHNGLRDIIQQTGKKDFYRLRIGIGHPGNKHQVHNYVLSKPNNHDKALIVREIDRSIHLINSLLTGENDKFMQALHTMEEK